MTIYGTAVVHTGKGEGLYMWSETFMHYCDQLYIQLKGEELDMWYSNTLIHCVQSLISACVPSPLH